MSLTHVYQSSGRWRRGNRAAGSGLLALMVGGLLLAAACGDGSASDDSASDGEAGSDSRQGDEGGNADQQRFPDVVEVEVAPAGEGTFDFEVTISSPYDTPERYADGWRIVGPDGTVYGQHELGHDHANEQPFTRSQSGVAIPDDIDEVSVEGHDLENGYGGETVTVALP